MALLRDTCAELGQAEVARRLGKSDSAVSQVLSGTYKGSSDTILERVEEVFGTTIIHCPTLGAIMLGRCADERRKPFAVVSGAYTRQRKACKQCDRRKQ